MVRGCVALGNKTLERAKRKQDDEFFTQLKDIVFEVSHYAEQFSGKSVYCNCDDPERSNFWRYFSNNFDKLKLKRLVASCIAERGKAYALEMWRDESGVHSGVRSLRSGDFRGEESIGLLRAADIAVTNPPFSLLREYIDLMLRMEKKFLVLGSQNAIGYKEIFPLFGQNRLRLGYYHGDMAFRVPADTEPREFRYWEDADGDKWRSLGNVCWFTNLAVDTSKNAVALTKTFDAEQYERYDNYNGINVDRVADIPVDYDGVMGVPITFLHSYNPEQFEIVGFRKGSDGKDLTVNGKSPFSRILIRRKAA